MKIHLANKTIEVSPNHELYNLEVLFGIDGEARGIITRTRDGKIWSAVEHNGELEVLSGQMPVGVYLV
jgi:hypothetical protein